MELLNADTLEEAQELLYLTDKECVCITLPTGKVIKNGIGIFMAYDGALHFRMTLPKIPQVLLQEVVRYFKEDLENERAIRIYYNKKKKGYGLYIPESTQISKATINPTLIQPIDLEPDMTYCVDIHSHNTMRAVFSWMDNEYDRLPLIYMVIGEMTPDSDNSSYSLRVGMDGLFQQVQLSEIFE